MKKLLSFLFIASLLLFSCEVEQYDGQELDAVNGKASKSVVAFDMDGCTGAERDLIAGQNMVVGSVSVTLDGDNYIITYNVSEADYCLTEAHVDVADHPENFAINKSGNPKIGNFEYSNDDVECTQEYSVTVPNKGPWLAVHGVVECSSNSPETILASLPETVDFCGNGFGPDAYISITVDGGVLTGDFGSYCVDNDAFINQNSCYEDMMVYVSTESLPDGIENTGNINAVNWVLNQDFTGLYTFGDIQYAIWLLLDPIEDDQPGLNTLGTYSVENAEAIAAMALENNDFVPGCGEYIGLVLKKDNIQPLIIPFPLDCNECEETVWAEGCGFPGNSWAMYFKYQ